MRHVAIDRVICGLRIPICLKFLKCADHVVRSHDSIRPFLGHGNMRRFAFHRYAEPEHTNLRSIDGVPGRLWKQGKVSAISSLERGKRAKSCTFLFDYRLEMYASGRFEAGMAQGIQSEDRGDCTRLHVACPTAIHPAIDDCGLERRMCPHIERAGRHNIKMPLKNERPAACHTGSMGAYDSARTREITVDRPEPRQWLQVPEMHLPFIDFVSSLVQSSGDEILRWAFLEAQAGNSDKIGEK